MRKITLTHEAINQIELIRASKKMSRHRVATEAGIAPSTYNNMVRGRSRPNFDTLLPVCQVLGIDILFRRNDGGPQ